jgi:hypothetical protein
MAELLHDVDLEVTGIVGDSRSYLSEDQQRVLSDYQLIRPAALFEAGVTTWSTPGTVQVITFTQRGGSVLVGSLRFTEFYEDLPPLQPGTEVLLLLERSGAKFRIAQL